MTNGYQPKSDGTPMGDPPNEGSGAVKNDPFLSMLDISLQHVSTHANRADQFTGIGWICIRADQLAYALYRTLEGDDAGGFALLRELGYTDENDEWMEDEE